MIVGNQGASPYLSTDFGATWTVVSATAAGTNHRSCAMSASGKYILLVKLSTSAVNVSSDFGVNWTSLTAASSTGVAKMSGDGKYQYIFGTGVKRSADFGASFSNILIGIGGMAEGGTVSPSGRVVVAGVNGTTDMRISEDYGVTFSSVTFPISFPAYISVACSFDGLYSTILFYGSNVVYKSHQGFRNFTTGTNIGAFVAPTAIPYGNAMSITGQMNIIGHIIYPYYGVYAFLPINNAL